MINCKGVALGIVFTGLSALTSAQLAVVDSLIGGNNLLGPVAGILYFEAPPMAQDLLAGNFAALPVASLAVDPAAVSSLFLSPQNTLDTVSGLALSLGGYTVPVLDVLLHEPAELPFYFLTGGAIFGDAVSALPQIPIVTVPL